MNDSYRQQWVENDEGLYNLYMSYRKEKRNSKEKRNIRTFIKNNRLFVTEVIGNILSGKRKAHYLAYELDAYELVKNSHRSIIHINI